jgi:hypothetical protein
VLHGIDIPYDSTSGDHRGQWGQARHAAQHDLRQCAPPPVKLFSGKGSPALPRRHSWCARHHVRGAAHIFPDERVRNSNGRLRASPDLFDRDLDFVMALFPQLNRMPIWRDPSGGERQMLAIARALMTGLVCFSWTSLAWSCAFVVRRVFDACNASVRHDTTILLITERLQASPRTTPMSWRTAASRGHRHGPHRSRRSRLSRRARA